MFIQKKLLKLSSLALMFFMAMTPISAITPKKSKSGKKTQKTASSTAVKTVKVVQTANSTEVATSSGDVVSLPTYNQILEDHTEIMPVDLLASADLTVSSEMLRQKMIEHQEMRELSERLQITIKDPAYLDFYREVADWLGTKYRRGGMSRKAVDCSGFTNIIYKNVFDIQLDRVSTVIAKNVPQSITSKEDLVPGDMVFFSTFKKKYINHVGIYIGEGKFIHASIKKGVIVSRLDEGYYSTAWRKGGRV
ncbi:MAG: C40 family peptidase [Dysgonomonas sp.]|nr:C40 family peptidase [Dysgonomonas sp.]